MSDTATLAGPSQQVAAEIRAEMARQKLSGRALATRLGRSQNWVSQKLDGQHRLDLEDLAVLARAIDLRVNDLLDRAHVTLWFPPDPPARPVGAFPQPALASTISTPLPHGPLSISHPAKSVQPPGPRRTAPTGR